MAASWFAPAKGGADFHLLCSPGASRSRIGEVLADGRLKIHVAAPPEDGKANIAIIALLAKEWGIPKKAFSIKRGESARQKTLFAAGDGAALCKLAETWYQARKGEGS